MSESEIKTHVGHIGRDVAEAEFQRFAASRKLDRKVARGDENDRGDFVGFRETVIDAIEDGALVFDDECLPVLTTMDGKQIGFKRPRGSVLTAMDRVKKNADMGKIYASMADMTGYPQRGFAQMDLDDLQVCLALYSLFML